MAWWRLESRVETSYRLMNLFENFVLVVTENVLRYYNCNYNCCTDFKHFIRWELHCTTECTSYKLEYVVLSRVEHCLLVSVGFSRWLSVSIENMKLKPHQRFLNLEFINVSAEQAFFSSWQFSWDVYLRSDLFRRTRYSIKYKRYCRA